jgi:hypothetical protein
MTKVVGSNGTRPHDMGNVHQQERSTTGADMSSHGSAPRRELRSEDF